MSQDAFTIFHAAKELDKLVSGAKIERINQPNKDSVVFSVRKASENLKLIVNANADFARVCVSNDNSPAPIEAPSFCMLLRKHLIRATVDAVSAVRYERIIIIYLTCRDELGTLSNKRLYCEIMGKYSNVTLVENDRILGALKTTGIDESLSRPIYPGAKYTLPPPQDKTEISDITAAKKALDKLTYADDPAKFIFTAFKGISFSTAEDIVSKFKETERDNDFVKIFKSDEFIKYFNDYYETPKISPTVVSDGKKTDFYIVEPITQYKEVRKYPSINSLIDGYYLYKENSFATALKKGRLYDAVKAYEKKLYKKLQIAEEKLLSCADMDDNRLFGELIIAYLYKIKSGEKYCEVENYYEPDYPLIKIRLDEDLSPRENAERYFKKYSKQKKTVAAVTPQTAELKETLSYIETVYSEIDAAETDSDFSDIEEELSAIGVIKQKQQGKKRIKKLSEPRKYVYKDFEILVGRNNLQNDRLTISAERNDIWLHTKDYHSSHVIIRTFNRPVPDEVLLFASEICAYFSKARSSKKVPVDHTLKKFVKKPAGTNAGKVYYTNQKTLFVDPDPHI